MKPVLYSVLYKALGVLAVLALVLLGIQQYGKVKVAAAELSTLQDATESTRATLEKRLSTDVYQGKQNAVLRERTRSALIPVRKEIQNVQDSSGCVSPEFIRVLNTAIADSNGVITASELPTGMR